LHEEEGPSAKATLDMTRSRIATGVRQGHRLSYVGTDKAMGRGIIRSPIGRFVRVVSIMGNVPRAKKRSKKSFVFLLRRLKERLEAQYEEASSQEIYARRKGPCRTSFWAHEEESEDRCLFDAWP